MTGCATSSIEKETPKNGAKTEKLQSAETKVTAREELGDNRQAEWWAAFLNRDLSHLTDRESRWRVKDDSLFQFRMSFHVEGDDPPAYPPPTHVLSMMKGVRFVFSKNNSSPTLKMFRTDISDDGTLFYLKRELGGLITGTQDGRSEPDIFLVVSNHGTCFVWHALPSDAYELAPIDVSAGDW